LDGAREPKTAEIIDRLYNVRSLLIVLTESQCSDHMSCVIANYVLPEINKINDLVEDNL
jgi:hypothetical protein